jgi:hypothetical protein
VGGPGEEEVTPHFFALNTLTITHLHLFKNLD